MTYVSRRTRIIVSRWSDECDAEYTLRACRKRSDGRLKKHSSCDDLRAWVNDNCIKNEHLVDLMSNGEFLGKPPFRLYGRFIPVPILFKLAQSAKMVMNEETETVEEKQDGEKQGTDPKDAKGEVKKKYPYDTEESAKDPCLQNGQIKELNSEKINKESKSDFSLTKIQWEKSLLEKSLLECTCILNKAVEKLEKIDTIVGLANDEIENARNEEIQEAFYKSKLSCSCSQNRSSSALSSSNSFSENLHSSKSYAMKLRNSVKCTELHRKISCLKEKLKKIQKRRQEIIHQIQTSQRKAERCPSSFQVTELYSRREQRERKKLQRQLEKLLAEKGKLLSEMCQAMTRLNIIKRLSRSNMSFRKKDSKLNGCFEGVQCEEFRDSATCNCGCKNFDNYGSTDSEKFQCAESSSADSGDNKNFFKSRHLSKGSCCNYQMNCAEFSYPFESSPVCRNSEELSETDLNPPGCSKVLKMDSGLDEFFNSSGGKSSKRYQHISPSQQKKSENVNAKKEQKEIRKSVRKSKVKFICQEPPCRRKLYGDDLSAFEKSLSPEQQAVILGAVKNLQKLQIPRPSTTPTTKREKQAVSLDYNSASRNFPNQSISGVKSIPKRLVKSEKTMKEIEKTLRNYEQRLSNLTSLECKVRELKQKSSEACWLKKKLAKVKTEAMKEKAVDREESNREITRLYSENRELKKQIQKLTATFDFQSKKIQNLKCNAMKAKELKCEAEKLKKELSEYRDSSEHQRKCISEWKRVVATQKTEIENLMNYIRNLTTMNEEAMWNSFQDKRYIQRTRSYSPEKIMEGLAYSRPKTQPTVCKPLAEEEESFCCSKEYRYPEVRRKSQLRNFEGGYYSVPKRGMEWYN